MNYQHFRQLIKPPLFSRQDLRLSGGKLFPCQLTLWQKKDYIVKLRNGLYAFSESLAELAAEEIAGSLYGPSYISLEKALSIYGLIPEIVPAITSVTSKATRTFSNQGGEFIFRKIKPSLFFGYSQKKGKFRPYLLAEPEKALLDLLYLKRINDRAGLEELRINWKLARKVFDKLKFKKYLSKYQKTRFKGLDEEILRRI